MEEEKKYGRRGRRAYLDDFRQTVTGEYIYIGATYAFQGTAECRKKGLLRWGLLAVGMAAVAVVGGCISAPGTTHCAYILLPYVLGTGGISFSGLNATGWVCLLIVGLVHTGAAYCLYFSALGNLRGQEAALLSYLDPLVAVLLSLLVLGEGLTPAQAAGGAMVLGFALWNEKLGKRREEQPEHSGEKA